MIKNAKKSAKKNSKKTNTSSSNQGWIRKNYVFIAVFVPILLMVGFFGYNKYLDWQNVNDMKNLLASFEQLERDVEAETGEDLYIEASCSSGGKFATFYSCFVALVHSNSEWSERVTASTLTRESHTMKDFGGCEMLSERSIGFEPGEDKYRCIFIVRGANEGKSEEIFFSYDTSPGRAY